MLLSIIIPTHERPQYIIPTIKSIIAISKDIEIVVTDTSQHDQISPHFTEELNKTEPRLKIIRSNKLLNVVENFELGLKSSSGRYLIFIGDDDFIHKSAIDIAQWAESNSVDSIKSTLPAHYNWPDYIHKRRGNFYAGKLFLNKFSSQIQKFDSKMALNEAAKYLGDGVLSMPRAYAGMISKKLANDIVKKYGSLFGGVSPDIYSSTLISIESERCYQIDYPFIIPGTSGRSTAGHSGNGKHVGKLRENAHIGAFSNLIWNELIPEFYSVPTVWSYSFVEAFNMTNNQPYKINYTRLYVKCLIYHFHFKEFIFKSIKYHAKQFGYAATISGMLKGLLIECAWLIEKVSKIIIGRFAISNGEVISGILDSKMSSQIISEKLSGKNLILEQI